jgi:hypothetical protein
MSVDATGALSHNARLMDGLRELIETMMPKVAEAMALDAASRAPDLDEEYKELNAEIGQEPLVARNGDRSGDLDGRTRFLKPEDTYLKNAIMNPINRLGDGNVARVGNLEFLEQSAQFTYTNIITDGHGHITGTETYTVHDYFQMFEGGKSGMMTVRPHTTGAKHPYPLRPGEAKNAATMSMVKALTPCFMFGIDFLETIAGVTITTALAEYGPGTAKS